MCKSHVGPRLSFFIEYSAYMRVKKPQGELKRKLRYLNSFTDEFHKVDFSNVENWTTPFLVQEEHWSKWQTLQLVMSRLTLNLNCLQKPLISESVKRLIYFTFTLIVISHFRGYYTPVVF